MIKTAKALTLISVVTVAAISMGAATWTAPSPVKHPHMTKTVTLKQGEVEFKLTYFTAPANEKHLEGIKVGAYNSSFGSLELSKDLELGEEVIEAGKHSIGAIKNGEDDWTLVLYIGGLKRGEEPDESKIIELESMFSTDQGNSGHVSFDLMPGHGELEGKLVLIWHFGRLYLAGALS